MVSNFQICFLYVNGSNLSSYFICLSFSKKNGNTLLPNFFNGFDVDGWKSQSNHFIINYVDGFCAFFQLVSRYVIFLTNEWFSLVRSNCFGKCNLINVFVPVSNS